MVSAMRMGSNSIIEWKRKRGKAVRKLKEKIKIRELRGNKGKKPVEIQKVERNLSKKAKILNIKSPLHNKKYNNNPNLDLNSNKNNPSIKNSSL